MYPSSVSDPAAYGYSGAMDPAHAPHMQQHQQHPPYAYSQDPPYGQPALSSMAPPPPHPSTASFAHATAPLAEGYPAAPHTGAGFGAEYSTAAVPQAYAPQHDGRGVLRTDASGVMAPDRFFHCEPAPASAPAIAPAIAPALVHGPPQEPMPDHMHAPVHGLAPQLTNSSGAGHVAAAGLPPAIAGATPPASPLVMMPPPPPPHQEPDPLLSQYSQRALRVSTAFVCLCVCVWGSSGGLTRTH